MSNYYTLNIHQRINYKGNSISKLSYTAPLFIQSRYDFDNQTIAISDWLYGDLYIGANAYSRPRCFDHLLYGQEPTRLSEFGAGDLVLRSYCGSQYEIAETNRIYYVLEDKETGRHSEYGLCCKVNCFICGFHNCNFSLDARRHFAESCRSSVNSISVFRTSSRSR